MSTAILTGILLLSALFDKHRTTIQYRMLTSYKTKLTIFSIVIKE